MRGAMKKIWEKFWGWLNIESNRARLAVIGPTIAALIGGLWIFYTWIRTPEKRARLLTNSASPPKNKKENALRGHCLYQIPGPRPCRTGRRTCARSMRWNTRIVPRGIVLIVLSTRSSATYSSTGGTNSTRQLISMSERRCPPPWHFETRPPAL